MADKLARIFGTEEDKVNCPFYFKIGACRHGDQCTKLHNKPYLSQTIIIPHMYENPPASIALAEGTKVPEEALKEAIRHFEDFYEEIFLEFCKYGELEEVNVSDNVGDHMIGNVYIKYYGEEAAEKALKALNGRWYAGRILHCEYSPVTDFREARCRQYEDGSCSRGCYCNFMHLKHVSRSFKRSLFRQMYDDYPDYRKRRSERYSKRHDSGGGGGGRSRSKSHSVGRSAAHKHSGRGDPRADPRDRDRDHRHNRSPRDHHRHHHGNEKHRAGHSRSRSRGRDKPNTEQENKEFDFNKKTSEERRAIIDKWNQEEFGNGEDSKEAKAEEIPVGGPPPEMVQDLGNIQPGNIDQFIEFQPPSLNYPPYPSQPAD